MDETMSNQQETAYITGLMEGEGSILLLKINARRRSNPIYRSAISFSNNDISLINFFSEYLKKNDINHHIRKDEGRKGKRTNYQISITKEICKKNFLEMIIPYMKGWKQNEAKMVLQFCKSRIENLSKKKQKRDSLGRFYQGRTEHSYTEKEIAMYEGYVEQTSYRR